MKILLTILSLLTGGFMLLDGIYVLLNGKYIGPEKPGPWALLFQRMHVDVFKLGPLFIISGLGWCIFLFGLWRQEVWAFKAGMFISLLTLWYLPVGTLFSVITLIILLFFRQKVGI
jgi:hypothetical protein